MRISDWSSDVCSSDLPDQQRGEAMKLLEGKVGIVTGGAKGLGHGISRRMAREGASLLITGRDGAATEKVAAEIRDEFGTQAIGISADVGIKEQIEAMVERSEEHTSELQSLMRISYAV